MKNIKSVIDKWVNNDIHSLDHLMILTYDHLLCLARQVLRDYSYNEPMQAAELVNELYIHFRKQKNFKILNSEHFFAIAVLKLKQILITRYEKTTTQKRSATKMECCSTIDITAAAPSFVERLFLDGCWDIIGDLNADNARLAELKIFWEFGNDEIAEHLKISESSVSRKWRTVKTLIAKKMQHSHYSYDQRN